jgi:F-type H+-transporting ATPase subunit b
MSNLLDINPGLIFWTLINFFVFLFCFTKLFYKPITRSIKARGEAIQANIDSAQKQNEDAKAILHEAQEKIGQAQNEMNEIILRGKNQAEELMKRALEEAEAMKRAKVEEASREIDRSKEIAIKQLRTEVAGLVVSATEKILDEKLDKDKHYQMVDSFIKKMPNN